MEVSRKPRTNSFRRYRAVSERLPRQNNVVQSARQEVRHADARAAPLSDRGWRPDDGVAEINHWPARAGRSYVLPGAAAAKLGTYLPRGQRAHAPQEAQLQGWDAGPAPPGRHPNGALRGGMAQERNQKVELEHVPRDNGVDNKLLRRVATHLNSLKTEFTGSAIITVMGASGLCSCDLMGFGKSDPYAVVFWDGVEAGRSEVAVDTLDPEWNYAVEVPLGHLMKHELRVEIYDYDSGGRTNDEFLGQLTFKGEGVEALPPATAVMKYDLQPSADPEVAIEFVRGKLQVRATTQVASSALAVYGQAWDEVSSAMTIYRPLLKTIKSVYFDFLADFDAEIEELQPTATEHDSMVEEREEARKQAKAECVRKVQAMQRELMQQRERKKAKEEEYRAIKKLLKETKMDLYESIEVEESMRAINMMLCRKIQSGEKEVEDTIALESAEADKFGEYSSMLDNLQNDLDDVNDGVQTTERKVEELQQRLLTKISERHKLTTKSNDLAHEGEKIQAKRADCKEETRKVRRNLGKLQRVIIDAQSGKRPLTPRPDWALLERVMAMDKSEVTTEQPSGMIVMDLLNQVETISHQIAKIQEELPWAIEQKKREAALQSKWFVCKGTGPSVPKFLRMQGKVRNRGMLKGDCEKFIHEFWEARTKALAKGGRESMVMVADYLYDFLKSRFGVPTAIAEFAYNLMDAVKRFAYDADCELFHRIITGTICEDTYADQMQTLEKFHEYLRKVETRKAGKKKVKGVLPREEFMAALKKHFPFKPSEDIASLRQALLYDQALPIVSYEKLFESDEQGDQGKFAETLRDQHLAEVLQAYSAIEDAIRHETAVDKMGKSFDGEAPERANVGQIMKALKEYDPKIPLQEINRILSCGMLSDPPFSSLRDEEIDLFCQRIRSLIIKRFSVPPEESAEKIAAKQLRSLMPGERQTLTELFAEFDADYSDSITMDEMKELVDHIYKQPDQPLPSENEDLVQKMFDVFDQDRSGEVQIDEFLHGIVCIPELQFIATHAKWKKLFRRYDADNSGLVDEAEVDDMLSEMVEFQGLEEAQQLEVKDKFMQQTNEDGEITWTVFTQIMSDLTQTPSNLQHFKENNDVADDIGEASQRHPMLKKRSTIGSTKYLSSFLTEHEEMVGAVGMNENDNKTQQKMPEVAESEEGAEEEKDEVQEPTAGTLGLLMQTNREIESAEAKTDGDAAT